jgi:hypothetical protein
MKLIKKNKWIILIFIIILLWFTIVTFNYYFKEPLDLISNSSSDSEIMSFTYLAIKIWPDNYETANNISINKINQSISMYSPGSDLLKNDENDLNKAKNKMSPMNNFINNGNILSGSNKADLLNDINAVKQNTGKDFSSSVSENTTITNNYMFLNKKYEKDTLISSSLMDMKKTTNDYNSKLLELKNFILNMCEMIDIQYYFNLAMTKNYYAEKMALKIKTQLDEVRKTAFDIKKQNLDYILNVDETKSFGDTMINNMKNIKNAWSMWIDFYKNGSRIMIDSSNSSLPTDWNSQSDNFKQCYSIWMNFETSLFENIIDPSNNNTMHDKLLNVVSDSNDDTTYNDLLSSYKNFTLLSEPINN